MAIKNYTTTKTAIESVGEIQAALAKGGAKKVMIDYDGLGEPVGVTFVITGPDGYLGFTLPANVEGVRAVFKEQGLKASEKQAANTAWRNIRDWVLAQLAFIEAGNASLQEAFLPYLTNNQGQTLYQTFLEGHLLLNE